MKPLYSVLAALLFPKAALALAAPVPSSVIPESVKYGEEGVKYLWNEVQQGYTHTVLPHDHQGMQDEWRLFLATDGKDMIESFYT